MEQAYDVIVIGAGNAGLSAAAALAQNGCRVLVLERSSVPGGCATSFVRGRFEFEPSLHELANVGTQTLPGSIRTMFDDLSACIHWVNEKNAFRVIADGPDGYDVTLPAGMDAFCSEMERLVPGCRDGVEAFLECSEKAGDALSYMSQGRPDPAVMMREHRDFMCAASHSVDVGMQALNIPPKAQSILKTYWPYLGAPTNELDLAHYAMMVSRYVKGGPAIPYMRSHELSSALDQVIRNYGGVLRYNAEVTEILVSDGAVCGVRVGAERLYASYVVANCFPDTAYSKLIAPSAVPPQAVRLANARKTGMLFFVVYLGLDRSAEELGIKDYSVFLFGTTDSVRQYKDCGDPAHSFVIANCLNTVIPDASPQNTCILSLTTMLTQEAWGTVSPENYRQVKNRIADRMIGTYENQLGISVRPHIEEIVVAAPPTFARYLNTPNGTPYGYEIQPWDTMVARIMSGRSERFIRDLYFVGAHAERSDGYSSTYANGRSVGEKIAKELGRNE